MIQFKKFDETKENIFLTFAFKNNSRNISDIGIKFEHNKLIIFFDKFLNKKLFYEIDNLTDKLNNKGYKIKKIGNIININIKKQKAKKWGELQNYEKYVNDKVNNYLDYNDSKVQTEQNIFLEQSNIFSNENENKEITFNHLNTNFNNKKNNFIKKFNLKNKLSIDTIKPLNNNKRNKTNNKKSSKISNINRKKLLLELDNSVERCLNKKNSFESLNNTKIINKDHISDKNKSIDLSSEFDKINFDFDLNSKNKNTPLKEVLENKNIYNKIDFIYNSIKKPIKRFNIDKNIQTECNKEDIIKFDLDKYINFNKYYNKINSFLSDEVINPNNNKILTKNEDNIIFIKSLLESQNWIIDRLKSNLIKEKQGRLKTEEQFYSILKQYEKNN